MLSLSPSLSPLSPSLSLSLLSLTQKLPFSMLHVQIHTYTPKGPEDKHCFHMLHDNMAQFLKSTLAVVFKKPVAWYMCITKIITIDFLSLSLSLSLSAPFSLCLSHATHPHSKVASYDNEIQLITETVHVLRFDLQPPTACRREPHN